MARLAGLHWLGPYEDELVEAHGHIRRLVALLPQPRGRDDEPAHIFDPAKFSRRAETMPSDRHFLTIAEAGELIAARKLSPVELTETYLARIAALTTSSTASSPSPPNVHAATHERPKPKS